ncbi:unnamed protein product [Nippostrongylus brasiliensis]|uniref:Exostosin domain-containing protein n=1 Tax=Nippostrongylus brasiliensis TaxID=27835 RepID=A0A0N4YRW1_NIPBR|nr:unnamed protein product [Nippostrongylus brasiliensis]
MRVTFRRLSELGLLVSAAMIVYRGDYQQLMSRRGTRVNKTKLPRTEMNYSSIPCTENMCLSDRCNSSLLYSNHDKWIVLTTWNEETEALRNLTTVQNWQVVVVQEPSAPGNFAHHARNMHFVNASVAFKLGLVFTFDDENSRRNIGYLYAIKNGAKYIYDGDENLHLYGQISNAFDLGTHASGLWHYGSGNSVRRYAGSKEIYAEINKFSPPVMVAPGAVVLM